MASEVLPYIPSKASQQAIVEYSKAVTYGANREYDIRGKLEYNDRVYTREMDRTEEQRKALMANKYGADPTKFQNIQIPVIMPQIESAVSYQTSVFLQGWPIFGCVSSPQYQDEAMQIDTIIGDQQVRGAWVNEFIKCFRDGFKHNLMAAEVDWVKEVSFAPESANPSSKSYKEIIWEGNRIKRMDLYNTFWDRRVDPKDIARFGEYAGYNELYSRMKLKQYIAGLPTGGMNIKEAFESSFPSGFGQPGYENYYIPDIVPNKLIDQKMWMDFDWIQWAGLTDKSDKGINYKNCYLVKTIYGRILPEDFAFKGVPGPGTPQVWKFVLVNNKVCIYAERLTNVHGLIPILFAQPKNDGLAYQTKSFSQDLEPIQYITSAIANSDIHGRRRAISDRLLYDRSRIDPAHINNDSPMAKIPVKPSAAGGPISQAVLPLPFNDNLFGINQQSINSYLALGNNITGFNPVRQGQFVKGNKTRAEFDSVMANSNGRDQLVAMSIEGDFMTPIKEVLKANILQYQGGTTLLNRNSNTVVDVDPIALRNAMTVFKISDGLVPSQELMDGDAFQAAMQVFMSVPAVAANYNIGPMFSYLFKTQGANIAPFEKPAEQIAFENAVAQWQQAVMSAAQQIGNNKDMDQQQIEQLLQNLPPQPKPEDYNYTPGQLNANPQDDVNNPAKPTILQQVTAKTNGAMQTNQASQPTGPQTVQ